MLTCKLEQGGFNTSKAGALIIQTCLLLFVIKGKVTFKPQNYCSFGKAVGYAR